MLRPRQYKKTAEEAEAAATDKSSSSSTSQSSSSLHSSSSNPNPEVESLLQEASQEAMEEASQEAVEEASQEAMAKNPDRKLKSLAKKSSTKSLCTGPVYSKQLEDILAAFFKENECLYDRRNPDYRNKKYKSSLTQKFAETHQLEYGGLTGII